MAFKQITACAMCAGRMGSEAFRCAAPAGLQGDQERYLGLVNTVGHVEYATVAAQHACCASP